MEEDNHPTPPKRPRRTDRGGDGDHGGDDVDVNDDVSILPLPADAAAAAAPPAAAAAAPPLPRNTMNVLPDETMVGILSYLDVRTLIEIKPLSHRWKRLSTTAIDSKGVGTTRKAFETNEELCKAVKRYCPAPQGGILYSLYDNNTAKQEYCDRETAEDIACTYGWPINKWDVSQIKDFSNVFTGGETRRNEETEKSEYVDGIQFFNETISDWDVSKATTMQEMFFCAHKFNQDLSKWDVSNVTNMMRMFHYASQFDQDISGWVVLNVRNMEGMFYRAKQFNQDISSWDVSNVITMKDLFGRTEQFNQDLSRWKVSNVTNMQGMFLDAKQFNQDISTWDVSNVTDMSEMFSHANKFNQDLSSWDVSNVIKMKLMFSNTLQFNQNLSIWNVSNVRNMSRIFHDATMALTEDFSLWDGWDLNAMTEEDDPFANSDDDED